MLQVPGFNFKPVYDSVLLVWIRQTFNGLFHWSNVKFFLSNLYCHHGDQLVHFGNWCVLRSCIITSGKASWLCQISILVSSMDKRPKHILINNIYAWVNLNRVFRLELDEYIFLWLNFSIHIAWSCEHKISSSQGTLLEQSSPLLRQHGLPFCPCAALAPKAAV